MNKTIEHPMTNVVAEFYKQIEALKALQIEKDNQEFPWEQSRVQHEIDVLKFHMYNTALDGRPKDAIEIIGKLLELV